MSDELVLVQNLIHEIRGMKVMLDFDLARMYHVTTSALNQAVKRNIKRFPPDFMFRITAEEWASNSSQIVTTSNRPKKAPLLTFLAQVCRVLGAGLRPFWREFAETLQTGTTAGSIRPIPGTGLQNSSRPAPSESQAGATVGNPWPISGTCPSLPLVRHL